VQHPRFRIAEHRWETQDCHPNAKPTFDLLAELCTLYKRLLPLKQNPFQKHHACFAREPKTSPATPQKKEKVHHAELERRLYRRAVPILALALRINISSSSEPLKKKSRSNGRPAEAAGVLGCVLLRLSSSSALGNLADGLEEELPATLIMST
jgi:hypothetical protein